MLRSLQMLEAGEYSALKSMLSAVFHAIILLDSDRAANPPIVAELADRHAAAFLDRQSITHPDERS